jgi:HEAT repeat protein
MKGFLKGLLKDQPDEVIAAAVEEFSNMLRDQDPEVDAIVTKWLKESDNPLLLHAGCMYWWLVKSRSKPRVTEEDVAAFERLAGHQETRVRDISPWAISDVATPDRPRMVAIVLRLTRDMDTRVSGNATRALRNANTPEVNVRLRELFESHQPEEVRTAAIEVLGTFGKSNLPLILSAVKADKEISVRQKAVYALRQIGTPEAGRGLEEALKDPDDGVRREARMQFDWFRREHPEWK